MYGRHIGHRRPPAGHAVRGRAGSGRDRLDGAEVLGAFIIFGPPAARQAYVDAKASIDFTERNSVRALGKEHARAIGA